MNLQTYGLSLLLLFVLDLPWLFYSSSFVKPMIYAIQRMPLQMNYLAAVPVYLAMAYLLNLASSPREAFFIGFSTYAVYDFTNLATLQSYNPWFAIADTLWGGILFALAYYVLQYILG